MLVILEVESLQVAVELLHVFAVLCHVRRQNQGSDLLFSSLSMQHIYYNSYQCSRFVFVVTVIIIDVDIS